MARPPAEHYELSDAEKRDLIALIEKGRVAEFRLDLSTDCGKDWAASSQLKRPPTAPMP